MKILEIITTIIRKKLKHLLLFKIIIEAELYCIHIWWKSKMRNMEERLISIMNN